MNDRDVLLSQGDNLRLLEVALSRYRLGRIRMVRRHGGTAAGAWRVRTDRGDWLVRKRGVRTSSDEAVTFDYGLRRHLVENGVPTATPVATRDGWSFVRTGESVFEVYPFVVGRAFDRSSPGASGAPARALAHFHGAAATYVLARNAPPRAQYATLGYDETSERMEDPRPLALVYGDVLSRPEVDEFRHAADECRGWLDRLNREFHRAVYDALPHTLTHGDYTAANLLFDETGAVVGVYDFDWARWAPRVRDIADGMYAFSAVRRSPLDPGDIWSLTDAADFAVEGCAVWLAAYSESSALSAAEIDAVPLAFAARWLSCRVEGMAKVPPEDRVRFCLRDANGPLDWVRDHWDEVKRHLDI